MPAKPNLLVIDDQPAITSLVADLLRDDWEVTEAQSAEQAVELMRDREWSVIFCDLKLGAADGFSALKKVKQEQPDTTIVLMAGRDTPTKALDAHSFGAYDYLLKPFGLDELKSLSDALRERVGAWPRRMRLGSQPDEALLGRSPAFISVMNEVTRIAATNLPVLLTGEYGTGKGLVASALHGRSSRANQPFVAVNCGAISADLIDSELFGHVKGAFAGADRDRCGLWEEANHGTVFLDDITETTLAFQAHLLRALQQGEIHRVGSNQTLRVDVRLIVASNRDVEAEVKAGRFRKDLFYRLNAALIALPPLRKRREDILLLAKSVADRVYSLSPSVKFSIEALEALERYPWPGNIRELENAVVRAAAICDGTIHVKDLPDRIQQYSVPQPRDTAPKPTGGRKLETEAGREVHTLAEVEGRHVAKVLAHTGGNKQAAARILDVDRKTLDRMIKRHDISTADIGKLRLVR